jgi:excisionase family DNA binding protein
MEELVDITELQRITSIKVTTLRKLVAHKRVPFVKIGRLVRFRLSEIDAWLVQRSVAVQEQDERSQGFLGL